MQTTQDFLIGQIAHLERMLALIPAEHVFERTLMSSRLPSLRRELNALSAPRATEPRIALTFNGKSVRGSAAMSSRLLTSTMAAFQRMVDTASALVRETAISDKGQLGGLGLSSLEFVGIARGSFGYELAMPNAPDLFANGEVYLAIDEVLDLIAAAVVGDQDFISRIEDAPARQLKSLQDFLAPIKRDRGSVQFTTALRQVSLTQEQVLLAHAHVAETEITEEPERLTVIFNGVFTASRKFEVTLEDGQTLHGALDEALMAEDLQRYDAEFLDRQVHALFQRTTVRYASGQEKSEWVLEKVVDSVPPKVNQTTVS